MTEEKRDPGHFPDDFLETWISGQSVLEVGCGAGSDAVRISRKGFNYLGIDLSEEAVWLTRQRLKRSRLGGMSRQADIFEFKSDQRFNCVFERGVFHNQKSTFARDRFAGAVHRILSQSGVWISISGSAETSPDPQGHGCLSRDEIETGTAAYFELASIANRPFGPANWPDNFRAWHCVLIARKNHGR